MTSLPDESSAKPEVQASSTLSNLTVRILTAAVLLPVAIAGMVLGGIVWALLLTPVAVLGVLEFYYLAHERPTQGSALVGVPLVLLVLLAFYVEEPAIWIGALVAGLAAAALLGILRHRADWKYAARQTVTTLAAVFYIGFPVAFMIGLRGLPEGLLWVATICGGTWGTDTFAYFGGRFFGRRKLAPRLSPKKTVEGAIIGAAGGFVTALVILAIGDQLSAATVVLSALIPLVAIPGDLLESAIKRYYDVKDSHLPHLNVVPGHGGMLDRIDSLLVVTAFAYFYITLAM